MRRFNSSIWTVVVFSMVCQTEFAWGQVPKNRLRTSDASSGKPEAATKPATKNTIIEFELLQGTDGSGLHSQQWLKTLEPLNVSIRIHRPQLDEKPDLKQRDTGNTRYITAVGTLTASGKIEFPSQSFGLGDAAKLKAWIEELRAYGIQGSPQGQPLWGLTKEQFTRLYDSLVKPIAFETLDQPVSQVVAKLPLPPQHPIHWSADSMQALAKRGDGAKVRQELKGLSVATALSVALNDTGLGFRPNRTGSGDIELKVEPRDLKSDQWPVGWPVQRQTFKAAPKLYAMVPVELADVELLDVLNAISQLSETPVLIDYNELDSKQIHLDKIKVSFPRKTTTWTIAIRQVIAPQKLTSEIWQDEAGRVFVWITTTQGARAKDNGKNQP